MFLDDLPANVEAVYYPQLSGSQPITIRAYAEPGAATFAYMPTTPLPDGVFAASELLEQGSARIEQQGEAGEVVDEAYEPLMEQQQLLQLLRCSRLSGRTPIRTAEMARCEEPCRN